MRLRSLLFVPGDRPDRMEKALASGADALILDLEDAVMPAAKAAARAAVAGFLARRDRPLPLIVRVNPVDSPLIADDLAALAEVRPDALMLPKAEGAASIAALDAMLGADTPPILPIGLEGPAALFTLGSYRAVAERLIGLTWGAADLPVAIGAATARADGVFTPPFAVARALLLFAAHAAGTRAIETVYPDIGDLDGLAAAARTARRDGFAGMLAIHPVQIAPINAAFSPDAAEIAHARAVIAAFAANPGVGALSLDGRMIDAPHLKAAERVLASL